MVIKTLDKIEEEIKEKIINSIRKNTPFKNIVLSTVSKNKPNLRIVILRNFSNDWNIFFYSDVRSKKIQEIAKNKTVSILLYDDEKKNQIRIYGTANIYRNQKKIWEQISISSKKNYNSIHKPGESQKNHLTEFNKKTELGYNNFCLIKVKISNMDCLYLSKKGNKRIKIKILREGKKITFKKIWVVP